MKNSNSSSSNNNKNNFIEYILKALLALVIGVLMLATFYKVESSINEFKNSDKWDKQPDLELFIKNYNNKLNAENNKAIIPYK